jgi:hypothetical protein
VNRLIRKAALFSAMPVLTALVCLPPEPALPPLLNAPVFTKGTVVIENASGIWQEMIRLEWTPSDSSYSAINEYVILTEIPFDTAVDSMGIIDMEPQRLPASKTFAYHPTESIRRLTPDSQIVTIHYRIFAIDSLDRSGDTSSSFEVSLLKTVVLVSPADTLHNNRFHWEFVGIADEIFSNMLLIWPDSISKQYVGDTSSAFAFLYDPLKFIVSLPDTLLPLHSGYYTWAVRTELQQRYSQSASYAVSYTIGTFYAP